MKKLTPLKIIPLVILLCHSLTARSTGRGPYINKLTYDPLEFHSPEFCSVTVEDPLPLDSNFQDLEEFPQDFVLETKKLTFDGFKGAFNPGIIKYKDSILIAFRGRDPHTGSTNPIVLAKLDKNFNPLMPPQILNIPSQEYKPFFMQQDPRLVTIGDRLFMIFCNMTSGKILTQTRRLYVTEILIENGKFIATPSECLRNFEGEKELRWEKNWAPFDYNGNLCLVYSLLPHRILFPQLGTSTCETIASTKGNIQWDWGILRGGTPAQIENDEYLSFFHSSKNMASAQSQGKVMQHYFMGAYTFSKDPPFEITRISKEPIVGKNFYNGPAHKTWKPLRVVFPCGFFSDENYIWVSYGRQDHEIWITKLDKKKLLESLVSVETVE